MQGIHGHLLVWSHPRIREKRSEQGVNICSIQTESPAPDISTIAGQYRSIFLQDKPLPEATLQFVKRLLVNRL